MCGIAGVISREPMMARVASFDRGTPPPAPIVIWKLMQWALWYDTYVESLGLREAE